MAAARAKAGYAGRRRTTHLISRAGFVVSRVTGRTVSGSVGTNSYRRTSRAKIKVASIVANAAPTHTRGPNPNGM